MEATSACDPSPPAMPRQSAPRATASRASCSRSSPWSSSTVSTPRLRASSTRPNFPTLPSPDHGLQSSTGWRGGRVRAAATCSSARMSWRRASCAAPEVSASRTTRAHRCSRRSSGVLAAARMAPRARPSPPTATAAPIPRRIPRRVIIHQLPAAATAIPRMTPRMKRPCPNSKDNVATTSAAPRTRARMARARRRPDTGAGPAGVPVPGSAPPFEPSDVPAPPAVSVPIAHGPGPAAGPPQDFWPKGILPPSAGRPPPGCARGRGRGLPASGNVVRRRRPFGPCSGPVHPQAGPCAGVTRRGARAAESDSLLMS